MIMLKLNAFFFASVPVLLGTILLLPYRAGFAEPPPAVTPEQTQFFEQNIRPIFAAKCGQCHSESAAKVQGGLLLDSREGWQKGGTSGTVIVPGKPQESRLIHAIKGENGVAQMPPGEKLTAKEISALEQWIQMGAPDPRTGKTAIKVDVVARGRNHWAFQPLKITAPPTVKRTAWAKTPIDRFLLAEMEKKGVQPNKYANRRTLIRRVTIDLMGLPPTPEDVETFVNDKTPNAWAKVVDRLLASPHYGERWGRHWLDLARFAESHGFEHDYDRPFAYSYRDFVIKALNADMPYNQFVAWQLAGDEFAPDDPLALAATGFLAAGVRSTQITKNQVEKERYDELDDMLATTGTAMLGLTLGCARCHDHKYDPIPTRDYYRMLSTFTTTVRSEMDVATEREADRKAKAAFDAAHQPLVDELARFEKDDLPRECAAWIRAGGFHSWLQTALIFDSKKIAAYHKALAGQPLTDAENKALLELYRPYNAHWRERNAAVQAHLAQAPKPTLQKMLISSEGVPAVRLHTQGGDFLPETHFLKRGDVNQKGEVVSQGFLTILAHQPETRWQTAPPKGWHTSYRRRAFADWITDPKDGAGTLLARVIVNRLWQHHFGKGIVRTPSDFGTMGERPTHPALLDYLASELIRGGWKLKPLHRQMLLSAAYLQSANANPTAAKFDPDNKLLARFHRQRVEAEVVRDSMLAVSGELDPTMYGAGTLDETMRRRSVYFTVKRSKLIPSLHVFDAPDALQGIGFRQTTTVAPQALMLLNSKIVREFAATFAKRLSNDRRYAKMSNLPTNAELITPAYLAALSRPPSKEEYADTLAFLDAQAETYRNAEKPDAELLARTDFCQALFSLNEFLFVE